MTTAETTSPTTADRNKHVVRELFEDAINHKRSDRLAALVSDDYVGPTGEHGAAAFAAILRPLESAFPDIQYKLDDVFAENDRVVARWTWSGTHTGTFRELPATQKAVTNAGIAIFELHDGKVVNQWVQTDRLGFLQALGVVPPELGNPPQQHH